MYKLVPLVTNVNEWKKISLYIYQLDITEDRSGRNQERRSRDGNRHMSTKMHSFLLRDQTVTWFYNWVLKYGNITVQFRVTDEDFTRSERSNTAVCHLEIRNSTSAYTVNRDHFPTTMGMLTESSCSMGQWHCLTNKWEEATSPW